MNIKVPTKYSLSQDRIVVFEIRLHSKNPMLCKPALHGNSNAFSLARRALKDKFSTPTVPFTAVLQNRQVLLPDPVNPFKPSIKVNHLRTLMHWYNHKAKHIGSSSDIQFKSWQGTWLS
jgi:hypothetical protein